MQAVIGKVCLDAGKRAAFGVWPPSAIGFDPFRLAENAIFVAQAAQRRNPGRETAEYPANVGLYEIIGRKGTA
jgi:hypothetical protein